ncbi:hypothetical protein TWF106_000700 [Orbilia oligospora]|uniref:Ribosomal protein/NADH dehydrogenase domain-containing protein n=1 Tax=Orbilia oligospora TaxID=2813651 RepID=A0A6G1LW56_ORBOL|nr:hypothetical protein TWF788_003509 [Orbilia oligospora]KAF3203916.1 hypothetical protein TWF191_002522 [Orbilia oligospora]KAF3205509.1 hypothetical protein TWF679_009270 [Orbilia oligospora]KAF3206500.1 hypothetical protein TWF106_000700 [Orbilia oligospora]KAF3236033.1 hypothetical protein TWF192_000548 [Orbilia oligospora]
MAARFAFSKQLKELRFHLCQSGAASNSLRSFISQSYPVMKKTNPEIPILIREAQGVPPRVFARYGQFFTPSILRKFDERTAEFAKLFFRIGKGDTSCTIRPF